MILMRGMCHCFVSHSTVSLPSRGLRFQAFMVGQANNDDVNRAVAMVSHPPCPAHALPAIVALTPYPASQCSHGMPAREAWEACGRPNGPGGIQNVRKRARLLREKAAAPTPMEVVTAVEVTRPSPASPEEIVVTAGGEANSDANPPSRVQPAFRLSSNQVVKQSVANLKMKAEFDAIYIEATAEWRDLVASGKSGRGDMCADAVAARHAARLPVGCELKLTGRSLKNALAAGRAGKAPAKRGPTSAIPDEFVQSIAEHAQLQQIEGDEQKPRQLIQTALASAKGTRHEENLRLLSQRRTLLRRVRLEHGLAVSASVAIDDRRWQWLTSSNLTTWFRGYIKSCYDWSYIPEIPEDIFEIIIIPPEKAARMGNGDETQQKLTNEGFKSGSLSHAYINPELGRAGRRKYEHAKHVTALEWVTYGGETGAPHLMLATDAAAAKKNAPETADPNTIRIRPEWTFGVPRVNGKFGHSSVKTFEPSFILNEKGGMCSGGLEQFVRMQILPAFPNLASKWEFDDDNNVVTGPFHFHLDAGPDRYTETSLGFRVEMWERGLVLFPGLPNGTAANQTMDDIFGLYKTTSAQVIDDIISERIAANREDPTFKVGLDFCDIGRVMN